MITALSAVLIGLSAIAVSVYETSLIRAQQKGSAWPYVEIGYGYDGADFRYGLYNTGVGPARIGYAVVRVDGVPVSDWRQFFQNLGVNVERYNTSFMTRVVAAAGSVEALRVSDPDIARQLFELQPRVSLEVCYCSVYDDCWEKLIGAEAIPVRSCNAPSDSVFTN